MGTIHNILDHIHSSDKERQRLEMEEGQMHSHHASHVFTALRAVVVACTCAVRQYEEGGSTG